MRRPGLSLSLGPIGEIQDFLKPYMLDGQSVASFLQYPGKVVQWQRKTDFIYQAGEPAATTAEKLIAFIQEQEKAASQGAPAQ